ncbi:DUF4124 domain-containing protein [Rheinheimera sp. MMS21-TC3]|uniref:DUF4124 domain-containing protein n=1 Tax=Rheinheimera sp. MMS21-TC3 TaxID=3072790 RepID=UPI0028C4B3F5|nr:DUF4124 domain-containing protein [Rheinheimera sp. MMS21-TC3]WNO59503.1 DUF4124 domain-containing protein [Rheinheimera sp. MMS21-TC3]
MMRFALLLLCGAFSAQAAVYKCEINGVVEFSQFPCATNAEQVDMRPVGTALSGTPGEYTQQVNSLKRKARYLEFKISKLEHDKENEVDQLKSELYKLRRSFPRSEELNALNKKIAHVEKQFDEKISSERKSLFSIKTKTDNLERQYAQN